MFNPDKIDPDTKIYHSWYDYQLVRADRFKEPVMMECKIWSDHYHRFIPLFKHPTEEIYYCKHPLNCWMEVIF